MSCCKEQGLGCDVLDLRSIFPYDWRAISKSVAKTGRVLIVNEDTEVTNYGEHLLRRYNRRTFLRPTGQAARIDGNACAGHRTEQRLRTKLGTATAGDSGKLRQAVATEDACRRPRLETQVNLMEFKLPELGEGVYEAELVSWHVQLPGDVVESGQNLLEVLTDKATMEVPAPFAGTIGPLLAEPGGTLKVGDVVLEYQPVRCCPTLHQRLPHRNHRPLPRRHLRPSQNQNDPSWKPLVQSRQKQTRLPPT